VACSPLQPTAKAGDPLRRPAGDSKGAGEPQSSPPSEVDWRRATKTRDRRSKKGFFSTRRPALVYRRQSTSRLTACRPVLMAVGEEPARYIRRPAIGHAATGQRFTVGGQSICPTANPIRYRKRGFFRLQDRPGMGFGLNPRVQELPVAARGDVRPGAADYNVCPTEGWGRSRSPRHEAKRG